MSVTQNVRDALLAPIQSLFSIACCDHVEACFMQCLHYEFADEWVVLDEEYLHCGCSHVDFLPESGTIKCRSGSMEQPRALRGRRRGFHPRSLGAEIFHKCSKRDLGDPFRRIGQAL